MDSVLTHRRPQATSNPGAIPRIVSKLTVGPTRSLSAEATTELTVSSARAVDVNARERSIEKTLPAASDLKQGMEDILM